MGYSGRVQCFCDNGHLWVEDPMEIYNMWGGEDIEPECPWCKNKAVFKNNVDDTNGESYGRIPPELLEIEAPDFQNEIKIENGRYVEFLKRVAGQYRIPTEEEAEELRTFIGCESGKVFFCKKRTVNGEKKIVEYKDDD